jgi:protein phosphatase
MPEPMLTIAFRTDVGKVRAINEDSVVWDPELGFAAVADGMGGHNAGEVASALAIDALRAFLKKSASGSDVTWPFGVDPALSFNGNRLMTAIKIANRRVFKAAVERLAYGGMGTTVVAALFEGARVTCCSVGDSRLYTLNGGDLQQRTRDDSWMAMVKEQSGLDAGALEKHPMRHVLTKAVGAAPDVDTTVQEFDLAPGEILMLSTDGLHAVVPHEAIQTVLASQRTLEAAADALVGDALARGGRDNVTVLLGRIDGARPAATNS